LGKNISASIFQNQLEDHMPRMTFIEHITGKVVQQIVLTDTDNGYEIDIQFTDRTGFHVDLEIPHMVIDLIELRDWKDGNGKLIKKFV
jgi:hypothetical protein